MQRAFVYKLYPSQEQQEALQSQLEILRHLYNNALAERIDAYQHEKRSISYQDQARQLPDLKQKAAPLRSVYSQCLQDCLKRLDKAYAHFFRRIKTGGKPGFPRFKGLGRYRSLTYPQWGSGASLNEGVLSLSKIGDVPIRLHRPLEGVPKTCTLSHQADGWHACIVCEVETQPLPATGQDVGVDVGIENFATFTDDHEPIANPRLLARAHVKLKQAQKRLERRTRRDKKGKLLPRQSRRREKAKVLLAKAHQCVARARLDFQRKLADRLVKQFDQIYIEHLTIAGMLKNHHLARAIADAGWGQFFSVLKCRAERAAKQVVEVCPRNTSQNCSECGEYVPKALSVRTHTCPYCGLVLHRDKNAAENTRKKGRDAAFRETTALAVV